MTTTKGRDSLCSYVSFLFSVHLPPSPPSPRELLRVASSWNVGDLPPLYQHSNATLPRPAIAQPRHWTHSRDPAPAPSPPSRPQLRNGGREEKGREGGGGEEERRTLLCPPRGAQPEWDPQGANKFSLPSPFRPQQGPPAPPPPHCMPSCTAKGGISSGPPRSFGGLGARRGGAVVSPCACEPPLCHSTRSTGRWPADSASSCPP